MMPWNLNYYAEQDKTDVCGFDITLFNQYFEMKYFIDKLLEFLQNMYNVNITIDNNEKGWHPSVQVIKISNHEGKDLRTVYLDMV